MKNNERLEMFLKLQSKGLLIDDIAKELGIATSTLRNFLSKNKYKLENGKYVSTIINKVEKTKKKTKKTTNNKVTSKIDKKINITQEDIDKLCEVYDWYMQIKDHKSIKIKTNNKKDIMLDNLEINELKSISIKLDKKTWEDFERLCSNSQYTKIQILTQALNDFMKQYKHLL